MQDLIGRKSKYHSYCADPCGTHATCRLLRDQTDRPRKEMRWQDRIPWQRHEGVELVWPSLTGPEELQLINWRLIPVLWRVQPFNSTTSHFYYRCQEEIKEFNSKTEVCLCINEERFLCDEQNSRFIMIALGGSTLELCSGPIIFQDTRCKLVIIYEIWCLQYRVW